MTGQGQGKKVTHILKFHLCEKCCRMIDITAGNFVRHSNVQTGATSYKHIECPPLKEKYEP